MSSGRRQSVLVFCISPLKELYLEPIGHYKPDMVYIFMDVNNVDVLSKIGLENYNDVKIECETVNVVKTDIHDYGSILAEMIELTKTLGLMYKDEIDIFINISSGTHEFAAAGMFASIVRDNATAFNVDVSDYGVKECVMRDFINKLSPDVEQPEKVQSNDFDEPKNEMLQYLMIIQKLIAKNRNFSRKELIKELKEANAWVYNPDRKENCGRTSMEKKESQFLIRHYIKPADNMGWTRSTNLKISLTEKGRLALITYGDREMMRESRLLCEKGTLYSTSRNIDYRKYSCMDSCTEDYSREILRPAGKTVEFERKGKRYRFSVNMEEH